MSKGGRHRARRSAVQALYQWQVTQQPPSDIESHFLADNMLNDADLEYFRHLVREIPLCLSRLDEQLTPYVDRAIAEIDPVERAILRLGAFELEFHLEIPYRVVLNEAVELAKTYGAEHGHKYINAVLDKVALNVRPLEVNGSGRSA
ncbi:MAG: N utilization substance protein B [Candidatus Muproteobacteria bacterium RBG_16_60_9]|jgi:N utilization substance protein B|uniref:Transcription antitermination protein NusB n=1 Tax=Candidatus Muproteobacteria bacterium RBG_16_60_9 TaxID=1817755 RepID=A0A1F6VI57_9PROT|nr:MAG: N utilization substance protein B [Candidatus Muproteobacteria bacterium RBG_16_60_9]